MKRWTEKSSRIPCNGNTKPDVLTAH